LEGRKGHREKEGKGPGKSADSRRKKELLKKRIQKKKGGNRERGKPSTWKKFRHGDQKVRRRRDKTWGGGGGVGGGGWGWGVGWGGGGGGGGEGGGGGLGSWGWWGGIIWWCGAWGWGVGGCWVGLGVVGHGGFDIWQGLGFGLAWVAGGSGTAVSDPFILRWGPKEKTWKGQRGRVRGLEKVLTGKTAGKAQRAKEVKEMNMRC